MSEINNRLLRLMLDAADRLELPLSVRQVETLARDVARDFEPPADIPALTQAEMRALVAIRLGETVSQTARRLFVSQSTIRQQRLLAYRKLGVSSAGEAVAAAIQCGLLRDEPLALLTAGVSA